MLIALTILVALLAFANGSNDNCKGVATLVGFGGAKPRKALIWATITTAIGAVVSFWLAGGLIKSFSGGGLFAAGTPFNNAFWVRADRHIRLDYRRYDRRHAGLHNPRHHRRLVGAGLVTSGHHSLQWSFLGAKFAMPRRSAPCSRWRSFTVWAGRWG